MQTIIDSIRAINNLDVTSLTPTQKKYVYYSFEIDTIKEIAEICGCSPQTVSKSLHDALNRLNNPQKTKNTMGTKNINFPFENYDSSLLTPSENEVMLLRISGMKYSEISKALCKSASTVGTLIGLATKKLNGKGDDVKKQQNESLKKFRERLSKEKRIEYNKKSYERYKEKHGEAIKEQRKVKNHQYYIKNRERILEQQKQREREKRAGGSD